MFLRKSIKNQAGNSEETRLTLESSDGWISENILSGTNERSAMKISTVSRCVEIRADSIGKLPIFIMDRKTKVHDERHPLNYLLSVRPNEIMTPFVLKSLIESQRLLKGNSYILPYRNSRSGVVEELLPLNPDCMSIVTDNSGALFYVYINPKSGEKRKFPANEILHFKAYSNDGITGISVIERARDVINTARQQQTFEEKFYSKNAQPSGILKVAAKLEQPAKDIIRSEWERIHSGADNAFRIAVLDMGLDYQPISMKQSDSQFIESKEVSVYDICRFFGVPPYKVGAGKQSYNSNEQNSIEYVVSGLHPAVNQYEDEYTYKLLFDREINKGMCIKINMNAELRGDIQARAAFYKSMWEIGTFCGNDIRALEDMPDVENGEMYFASKNYAPLERFKNGTEGKSNEEG